MKTIKTAAETGIYNTVTVEVEFYDDAAAALEALNAAYADARSLLESQIPTKAVAEVWQQEKAPLTLIDSQGDAWVIQPNGYFRMQSRFGEGNLCEEDYSRAQIESTWGPLRAVLQ